MSYHARSLRYNGIPQSSPTVYGLKRVVFLYLSYLNNKFIWHHISSDFRTKDRLIDKKY